MSSFLKPCNHVTICHPMILSPFLKHHIYRQFPHGQWSIGEHYLITSEDTKNKISLKENFAIRRPEIRWVRKTLMKDEVFIIQYVFFIWTTYKTATKRLIKKLFEQIIAMFIAGISDPRHFPSKGED